jgi:dihydrofolate reductase
MAMTTSHATISLDGYSAGPEQTESDPLGRGGEGLHQWMMRDPLHPADERWRALLARPLGACVMGRNMFGPVRGVWDRDWRGWWGEDPPYHCPVFVLSHYPHDPIGMAGGTTFHFVDDFDEAMARAREAAGPEGLVRIAGGASTVQQALRAGVLEELTLDVSPITLGSGERLLDGLPGLRLEPVETAHSPLASHVRYRVLSGQLP